MSHRRSGKSGSTDLEFEELKYKYHEDLRDGSARSIKAVDKPVNGVEEPLRSETQNVKNIVAKDDLMVFPWMGIVANILVEYQEGKMQVKVEHI